MPFMFVCALATISSPLLNPNTIPTEKGFISLFDGKTTKGWHGYKRNDMPKAWKVVNGTLNLTPGDDGGDISSDAIFSNFELRLDWKISKGGNSGIMYRADEGHAAAYMTGPEMQVLDDKEHPDGRKPVTSAGSCYGLYACSKKTVKPAGHWNSVRIIVNGRHVEHWLNGSRVVSYDLQSDDWNKRVAESKFSQMPDYGTLSIGHIVLQDHGNQVSYRNIRIKRL